jgi:multiple sugar transport system permease protein
VAGQGRVRPLRPSKLAFKLTYKRQLFLLLLPYLFGLAALVALPALLSIPFAFTHFDALSAPRWAGLENFGEMFGDSRFWNGLNVSLFFIAIAVPLRLVGAVLLAFLLYKPRPSNRLYRVLVVLPTIVPDVAYALLWLYIFNPIYGPLNWILPIFGASPTGWLLQPGPAKFGVVVMMLWTIGEGFVLMLAALQDIPGELQEAAAVDGASGAQRFTKITLPLLAPAMLLLLFRDTIFSFQANFVPAIVTFEEGGPIYSSGGETYRATEFLPVYIWHNLTEFQDYGYAAAMTWIMYIVTALVVALQFIIARRWRATLNS